LRIGYAALRIGYAALRIGYAALRTCHLTLILPVGGTGGTFSPPGLSLVTLQAFRLGVKPGAR